MENNWQSNEMFIHDSTELPSSSGNAEYNPGESFENSANPMESTHFKVENILMELDDTVKRQRLTGLDSGNRSVTYRVDIPIDTEQKLNLTSIIKTPLPNYNKSSEDTLLDIRNEAQFYKLALEKGVTHIPQLLAYNEKAGILHVSFLHSQRVEKTDYFRNDPVEFAQAAVEALHDFHSKGLSPGDQTSGNNLIYFRNAVGDLTCTCIDFGISTTLETHTPYDFNKSIRTGLHNISQTMFVKFGIFSNPSYMDDAKKTAAFLEGKGFTTRQAQLLYKWIRPFNQNENYLQDEEEFLAEMAGQESNVNSIANEVKFVEEPDAFERARKVQDALNEKLIQ